jgi:mRNA interferase MazF
LVLADLPGPYQGQLVCGISTQLNVLQRNWDETLAPGDADFKASGLHQASAVRLSNLHAADRREIVGVVGAIDPSRLQRLRERLSDQLRP